MDPVVRIDTSCWPIVVTTMGDGVQLAHVHTMLERYGELLQRQERYVGMVDLTPMSRPPGPQERALIARWSKGHHERLVSLSLGYAIIVPNTLVRGALTAMWWLHETPSPEVFVPDARAALGWCAERLREAGLDAPREACLQAES